MTMVCWASKLNQQELHARKKMMLDFIRVGRERRKGHRGAVPTHCTLIRFADSSTHVVYKVSGGQLFSY